MDTLDRPRTAQRKRRVGRNAHRGSFSKHSSLARGPREQKKALASSITLCQSIAPHRGLYGDLGVIAPVF